MVNASLNWASLQGILLFIWSYTKITLRGANCSTINNNYKMDYISDLKSLYDKRDNKMDDDNMTNYGDEQDLTTGQDKRKLVGDYRLRDFYIKTAYNCCASGSYSHDFVDMCALENCIKLGARCLDFEVYSFDNKPIIALSSVNDHNIKETYNYLTFDSVMEKIRAIGLKSGVKSADVFEYMYANEVDKIINSNFEIGRKLGLEGTPSFLINNKVYRGHIDSDNLKEIINTYRRQLSGN